MAASDRAALTARFQQLARQDEERRLASFTCDDAWTLGQYAREAYERHSAGAARRVGVAIQIHSFDGQVLFACVVGQGATPRLGEMIRRKIETVRVYSVSSYAIGRKLLGQGKTLDDLGPDHAPHGGAVPIFVRSVGAPVGAIAVSGLSQEVDHAIAVEALERHISAAGPAH
ncbi:DUF336-domain-containing protein [Tilletiopsis washingtonensis]|uniref:DUF336-domain-containing protein n=1 Tax=Tilletiopsis washingtonensis TaxID=58919 RepID=A0A316YZB5_9BASI|nr:DUF336-domain-containing protein [Tilletiopsis washingtonensis]PWN94482.1 DUF336-domain-containing protein [Tilletiopsis washingtonensis]